MLFWVCCVCNIVCGMFGRRACPLTSGNICLPLVFWLFDSCGLLRIHYSGFTWSLLPWWEATCSTHTMTAQRGTLNNPCSWGDRDLEKINYKMFPYLHVQICIIIHRPCHSLFNCNRDWRRRGRGEEGKTYQVDVVAVLPLKSVPTPWMKQPFSQNDTTLPVGIIISRSSTEPPWSFQRKSKLRWWLWGCRKQGEELVLWCHQLSHN